MMKALCTNHQSYTPLPTPLPAYMFVWTMGFPRGRDAGGSMNSALIEESGRRRLEFKRAGYLLPVTIKFVTLGYLIQPF